MLLSMYKTETKIVRFTPTRDLYLLSEFLYIITFVYAQILYLSISAAEMSIKDNNKHSLQSINIQIVILAFNILYEM